MFSGINKLFGQKPASQGAQNVLHHSPHSPVKPAGSGQRSQTYAKVFRWHLRAGQLPVPHTVEIVGSFTNWEKIPLQRDVTTGAWHTTIHHILGNKTHHYMLLVDGQPANDENSDGLAKPTGPEEEQYQLMTARGPRVFMLFAQAK